MKFLFKSTVLLLPLAFIAMFYILLTEEDAYPGTDYKTFDIPKFQLENLVDFDLFRSFPYKLLKFALFRNIENSKIIKRRKCLTEFSGIGCLQLAYK